MHGWMDMLVCMRWASARGWARVAGHPSSSKLHTEVHTHLLTCTRLDCRRPCGGPSVQRAEVSGEGRRCEADEGRRRAGCDCTIRQEPSGRKTEEEMDIHGRKQNEDTIACSRMRTRTWLSLRKERVHHPARRRATCMCSASRGHAWVSRLWHVPAKSSRTLTLSLSRCHESSAYTYVT